MPAQRRSTRPGNLRVRTVAAHLEVPWALAFGPEGRLFVTERPGRIRVLPPGRSVDTPPILLRRQETLALGEGGLMGIALHPDFPDPGWIYLSETYGSTWNPRNRILRLRRSDTGWVSDVLVEGIPAASYHNGSRLAFGPDGYLYATTGDAGEPSLAQRISSWAGKILRMTPDGRPAGPNPFQGSGAAAYVYSYGHRNPQGLAWHPTSGRLYASEHGPSGEFGLGGRDEINAVVKGGNYGWPEVVGAPGRDPYRDPLLLFHKPHLPPAGMAFWAGSGSSDGRRDLFVASLRGELLLRVGLSESGTVEGLERLFEEAFYRGVYGRLRAVTAGPDGGLYVTTSNRDGRGRPHPRDDRILRLTPRP